MGIELKKKKQLIERLNRRLLSEKEMECPKATQDLELNTNNRDKSINADYIKYGPLNIDEPGDYWEMVASEWNTTVEAAKKSLCGNCSFFVQTKAILDCIASGINDANEWDTIDAGDLGYCEAFDFKCAANRTCDAWVGGGPIVD